MAQITLNEGLAWLDVKSLDRPITRVAREIRLLEQAMKATNAKTVIDGYEQDDAALGELT